MLALLAHEADANGRLDDPGAEERKPRRPGSRQQWRHRQQRPQPDENGGDPPEPRDVAAHSRQDLRRTSLVDHQAGAQAATARDEAAELGDVGPDHAHLNPDRQRLLVHDQPVALAGKAAQAVVPVHLVDDAIARLQQACPTLPLARRRRAAR
jgi:hypothetical protein